MEHPHQVFFLKRLFWNLIYVQTFWTLNTCHKSKPSFLFFKLSWCWYQSLRIWSWVGTVINFKETYVLLIDICITVPLTKYLYLEGCKKRKKKKKKRERRDEREKGKDNSFVHWCSLNCSLLVCCHSRCECECECLLNSG